MPPEMTRTDADIAARLDYPRGQIEIENIDVVERKAALFDGLVAALQGLVNVGTMEFDDFGDSLSCRACGAMADGAGEHHTDACPYAAAVRILEKTNEP